MGAFTSARAREVLVALGQLAAAVVVAVGVAVVSLLAIARVEWPAFPSSNQLHALTTVARSAAWPGWSASAGCGGTVDSGDWPGWAGWFWYPRLPS